MYAPALAFTGVGCTLCPNSGWIQPHAFHSPSPFEILLREATPAARSAQRAPTALMTGVSWLIPAGEEAIGEQSIRPTLSRAARHEIGRETAPKPLIVGFSSLLAASPEISNHGNPWCGVWGVPANSNAHRPEGTRSTYRDPDK